MSVAVVEAVISWRKQKESGLKPQEEQQQEEEEEENIYIVHQEEVNTHTHTQAVIHTQLRSYTHTLHTLFVCLQTNDEDTEEGLQTEGGVSFIAHVPVPSQKEVRLVTQSELTLTHSKLSLSLSLTSLFPSLECECVRHMVSGGKVCLRIFLGFFFPPIFYQ